MENKISLDKNKYGQEVYNNTLGRLRDLDLMSDKYWFVFENIDRDSKSYNIYWSWLVASNTRENAIQCVAKHEGNEDCNISLSSPHDYDCDYEKPIYEAVEMHTHCVDHGAPHWLVFADQADDSETGSVDCSWLVSSHTKENAIRYVARLLGYSGWNCEAIQMIPIRP